MAGGGEAPARLRVHERPRRAYTRRPHRGSPSTRRGRRSRGGVHPRAGLPRRRVLLRREVLFACPSRYVNDCLAFHDSVPLGSAVGSRRSARRRTDRVHARSRRGASAHRPQPVPPRSDHRRADGGPRLLRDRLSARRRTHDGDAHTPHGREPGPRLRPRPGRTAEPGRDHAWTDAVRLDPDTAPSGHPGRRRGIGAAAVRPPLLCQDAVPGARSPGHPRASTPSSDSSWREQRATRSRGASRSARRSRRPS